MKTKKLLTLLGAGFVAFSIAACGTHVDPTPGPDTDDPIKPDDTSSSVTLSMAVNYDKSTGLKYNQDAEYTTPAGTVIKNGDFKPVWQTIQSKLNFVIDDVTSTNEKAIDQFKNNWGTAPYADIACGNVTDMVNYSVSNGTILNLKNYLKYMPNFSQFLEENPIVKVSIETASYEDNNQTGIYYMPYFDGFADLEKMTLLRADWVRKLLDTDYSSVSWDTDVIWSNSVYTSTVTTDSYKVDVTRNSKATTITKQKVEKGIIEQQNELSLKNGANLVKQFREYLEARYKGCGYSKLSDIFLGSDAAYDADDMIALMRVVKASPLALTGSKDNEIVVFVPREYNNQRIADLYRWAGQLWGVRGVESRSGYLYFDTKGNIHDARGEEATTTMLENLNKLYQEGLIAQNFENKENYGQTSGKLAEAIIGGEESSKYKGFMEYDYAQTQGVWNDKPHEGEFDFRPVLGGVADWDDGTSGNYIHFTESWRSVKTQAWCLNADLAKEGNEAKLSRALKLIDFLYSDEGHDLNSFGPASEGYTNGTTTYLGKEIPAFSAKALEQLNDKSIGNGSYTNYLRKYVGATLPIGYIKEQGMEYQCTSAKALNGLSIINEAIIAGTYKHVECAIEDNMFYTISPSSYFISKGNQTIVSGYEDKSKLGSINSTGSTNAYNIWDKYVMYGFGGTAGTEKLLSKSEYLTTINTTWSLTQLLQIYQDAWALMEASAE